MKKILFIFIVIICILKTENFYAQWQPDVRLTNHPANSYTSENNAWCVVSSGDFVHAVWFDNRDGNNEIYYKRSTNGGVSWGVDTRLTNANDISAFPSIALSGSVVHVVWGDLRNGIPNYEIYYKCSTDGGVSWGTDIRLTNNGAVSVNPSISVVGQVLHVVWEDYRDSPNGEIYHKRSTNGGVSWEVDTRLTNNGAYSVLNSIAVSGQFVHVVWQDFRDGNAEIYYKRSTDGGVIWGADTRFTNNTLESSHPSISVSGQVLHVVWMELHPANNKEIYYKRSTDGGTSWEADARLTNDPAESWSPSVSISGQAVHIVWEDNRDGNSEIYYKRSIDGGVSWGADTRLTNNTSDSWYPSVSVSGQVVHVVWQDQRDGNWEIYYKRNPIVVGIEPVNSEIPEDFELGQNYPNPFNPVTKIRFCLPAPSPVSGGINSGGVQDVRLIVYNILGRQVATLVSEKLRAGTYEVEWPAPSVNASDYPSGVYYYQLITGEFKAVRKMVLIK